ncbi:AMP-binding protein [Streptomyces sp. NPDC051172]|uniref:AMP-binding protein n=1 Tax=Streptomyces sp. NPDC051172 TaxID=3155796 RepID=UPI0034141DEA
MIAKQILPGRTLSDALHLVAQAHPEAASFYPGTGEVLTAAELDALATGYAAHLRRNGVGPGDLVGLIHGTGPDFLACLFAVLRAGAAASVLPVPSRSADRARVKAGKLRIFWSVSSVSGQQARA